MLQTIVTSDGHKCINAESGYSFRYPVTFRKTDSGISFTQVQLVFHAFIWLFIAWAFWEMLDFGLENDFREAVGPLIFLGFTFTIYIPQLLSIIPDIIVDQFEGGSEIKIFEDGVLDTRISKEKLLWADITSPKIVSTPVKGVVLVRFKIKKDTVIHYRKFRYDIMCQKLIMPLRNKFVYLLIRKFNQNPDLISHIILHTYSENGAISGLTRSARRDGIAFISPSKMLSGRWQPQAGKLIAGSKAGTRSDSVIGNSEERSSYPNRVDL